MIKPDQIPKEVVAAIQICTGMSDAAARGLAVIMLEQWPGMICYPPDPLNEIINPERITLPLSHESGDETVP